jgi:hypothetical protein
VIILNILGREVKIAPYKLGAMIEAAPFIDAQRERQRLIGERTGIHILPTDPDDVRDAKGREFAERTTMVEMMATMKDCIGVLHIGVRKADPTITLEDMLDSFDPVPEDFAQLMHAMNNLLRGSGMQEGEAPAPAQEAEAPAA